MRGTGAWMRGALAVMAVIAAEVKAAYKPPPLVVGSCATYNRTLPDLSLGPDGSPYFDWNAGVPVYTVLASPAAGGLSDEIVGFLASHPFALITIAQRENIAGAPFATAAESKIAVTATRLKQLNPTQPNIFYVNTMEDLSFFSFYCQTQQYLLKAGKTTVQLPMIVSTGAGSSSYPIYNCKTGKTTPSVEIPVFDWTSSKMITAWLSRLDTIRNFTYGKDQPLFSGVFMDLAEKTAAALKHMPTWTGLTPAQIANFDIGHNLIMNLTAAKFKSQFAAANNFDFPTSTKVARQYERFMFFDFIGLSMFSTLVNMIAQARSGRIMLANATPCGPDTLNGSPVTVTLAHGITQTSTYVRAISLAGFLVAACHGSYYSCNGGYDNADVPTGFHDCWLDEYNKPLGPPLGAAKTLTLGATDYFYRAFSTGTYAIVMTSSRTTQYQGKGCVCWADGTSVCSSAGTTCSNLLGVFQSHFTPQQLSTWTPDGCNK